LKEYQEYLEKELEKVNLKLQVKKEDDMKIDNIKSENDQNLANVPKAKELSRQSSEIQKCIDSLKECIKNLEQIQTSNNNNTNTTEPISNNEVFSLKLYIDNINNTIKKQLNKH